MSIVKDYDFLSKFCIKKLNSPIEHNNFWTICYGAEYNMKTILIRLPNYTLYIVRWNEATLQYIYWRGRYELGLVPSICEIYTLH